ncbi:MAG: M42 family peptidase [Cytophagales bacterium]|nr:MAG: M42 family peptidase [Cytophagales bacterium]TAF60649.1 MAG: M42 family peptidase [Cytophagales bacterium]
MNQSFNTALLSTLTQAAGVSGFEDGIRGVLLENLKGLVDSVEVDNIGNVYAYKKGEESNAPTLLVEAHIDEIGYVVSHIEDKGFLRFHTLGGFDPKTFTAQRVQVHGRKTLTGVIGSRAIHSMKDEERAKAPKQEDFFIDLGLPKEEVVKYVSVGNPITRVGELIEIGNCVSSRSLDNRVSVFIILEALKKIQKCPYNLVATFTVQEEVGLRGAMVAAHKIDPDFAICLDVTIANDTPGGGSGAERVSELGEGAAIKILDGGVICDPRMVDFLRSTADRNSIKHQNDLLILRAQTTTHMLQLMGRKGAVAGGISIPTRYLHQTIETAHKEDITACIELLAAAIETVNKFHWER